MNNSIKEIYELIEKKNILNLMPDYCGSCPCGNVLLGEININMHCWRTSFENCNCKYSGLHISSQDYECKYKRKDLLKIGKLCLKQISQFWHTEFELVIED